MNIMKNGLVTNFAGGAIAIAVVSFCKTSIYGFAKL
jgi:hypothetical protein